MSARRPFDPLFEAARWRQKEAPMGLAPYRKTVAAVVTGTIGWAAAVVTSDPTAITAAEWVMGATALATALGVYVVANEPA